jgi:hypothetical protein
MPPRTPRFAKDNLLRALPTVVTASSFDPLHPVRHLLFDELVSKRWRSLTGWSVLTEYGDRLPFVEGGTPHAASIPVGQYLTGTALAAAITTAMNAVGGIANTYLATYNDSVGQFTLARATGGASFSLPFGTGANLYRSVHRDLGFFLDEDLTGSASYSTPFVVRSGRQWIRFAFGQDVAPPWVVFTGSGLVGHLFGAPKVQYMTNDNPIVWNNPDSTDQIPFRTGMVAGALGSAFISPATNSYGLLEIHDPTNKMGYVDLGALHLGSYLQPPRVFAPGFSVLHDDLSIVMHGDQGSIHRSARPVGRRFDLEYRLMENADMKNLTDLFSGLGGVGAHLFVALDAQGAAGGGSELSETVYAALVEPLHVTHTSTSEELGRYSTRLVLLEEIS